MCLAPPYFLSGCGTTLMSLRSQCESLCSSLRHSSDSTCRVKHPCLHLTQLSSWYNLLCHEINKRDQHQIKYIFHIFPKTIYCRFDSWEKQHGGLTSVLWGTACHWWSWLSLSASLSGDEATCCQPSLSDLPTHHYKTETERKTEKEMVVFLFVF